MVKNITPGISGLQLILLLFLSLCFISKSTCSFDKNKYFWFKNEAETIVYKIIGSVSDFTQVKSPPLGPLSYFIGKDQCAKGVWGAYRAANYTGILDMGGYTEERCYDGSLRPYESLRLFGSADSKIVHFYPVELNQEISESYFNDTNYISTYPFMKSLILVGFGQSATFYSDTNYSGDSKCVTVPSTAIHSRITNITSYFGFPQIRSFKFGCNTNTADKIHKVLSNAIKQTVYDGREPIVGDPNNFVIIKNQANSIEYKFTGNVPDFSQLHGLPLGPLSTGLGNDICDNGMRCIYSGFNYTGTVGCAGYAQINCHSGSLRAFNSILLLGNVSSTIAHFFAPENYQGLPVTYTTDNPYMPIGITESIILVGQGLNATFYASANYEGASICMSAGPALYARVPSTSTFFGFSDIRSFKFGCHFEKLN